ncbi:hypothetical protein PGB90_004944 [Kerria lacca]
MQSSTQIQTWYDKIMRKRKEKKKNKTKQHTIDAILILEFFKNIYGVSSSFIKVPVVKADDDDEEDELVDTFQALKIECRKKKEAAPLIQKLEECNLRVRSRKKTKETCEEEFHDLIHFLDHCAAREIFRYIK